MTSRPNAIEFGKAVLKKYGRDHFKKLRALRNEKGRKPKKRKRDTQ
jgi:hypothetical protein